MLPVVPPDHPALQTMEVNQVSYLEAVTRRGNAFISPTIQLIDNRLEKWDVGRVIKINPNLITAFHGKFVCHLIVPADLSLDLPSNSSDAPNHLVVVHSSIVLRICA